MKLASPYHQGMTERDHLEAHLRLCQRIYERLKRNGEWPWADSTDLENMVDSDDNETRA